MADTVNGQPYVRLVAWRSAELLDLAWTRWRAPTVSAVVRGGARALRAQSWGFGVTSYPTGIVVGLPPRLYQRLAPSLGDVRRELSRSLGAILASTGQATAVAVVVEPEPALRTGFRITVFEDDSGVVVTHDPVDGKAMRWAVRGPEGLVPLSSNEEMAIGRLWGTHRIDDPLMSAQHARVRVLHGQPMVEDLGSKNGTRLNGTSVSSAVLTVGDVIKCGSTTFHVEQLGSGEVGG